MTIDTRLTVAAAALIAVLLGLACWFAGWFFTDGAGRLHAIGRWTLGMAGFLLTYFGLFVFVWSAAQRITRVMVSGGIRSELAINAAITLFAVALIWLLAIAAQRVRIFARALQGEPPNDRHARDE